MLLSLGTRRLCTFLASIPLYVVFVISETLVTKRLKLLRNGMTREHDGLSVINEQITWR